MTGTATARILARDIIAFVADDHGMSVSVIMGTCRRREFARPRQVAMYAIRQLCPHLSYPAIGRALGGRDHATVIHGARTIEAMMASQPEIATAVARVMRQFNSAPLSAPTPAAPTLFEHAMAWQALCNSYGRAMRAAA